MLAATIGIAVVSAPYPVFGAMIKPLQAAYGWNRGSIAMALTIASVISPFGNIAAGVLVDRFGPRRVVLIGALLFGCSYALLGLTGPALWTWYAGYGLYAICSQGIGAVAWTTLVVRRFEHHRGIALAVTLSGTGVVIAALPSVVLVLLGLFGVRGTYYVLGCTSFIIVFIPAFFFFREDSAHSARVMARRSPADYALIPGLTVAQTLSTTRYWRLASGLCLIALAVGVFTIHFQPLLVDAGMPPWRAAKMALFLGPAMIVGRLLTGALFDRFPAQRVAAVAFSLPSLACLALILQDGTIFRAAVAAVVMGVGMGAELDVLAYLTSRYFGLKRYGVLFGSLTGVYGIGVGIGSALAGHVFDATGSYHLLLWCLACSSILATALIATLGRQPAAFPAAPA